MTGIPDSVVLKRDRDLDGRQNEIWVRRGLFALVCAIPVLALFNLFGQRPGTSSAATPAAKLSVYAPARVRSGLLWEARFHLTAHTELKKATLVLDPGWLEGSTLNTVEPSPAAQSSANGSLTFYLGHIPAGQSFILFLDFQTNPTNVGHRHQTVTLYDGDRKLLTVHRTITVFP
jgi:hypothetical protein